MVPAPRGNTDGMAEGLACVLLRRLEEFGEGGFTLLDEEELLALFPPKAKIDKEGAEKLLFSLAERKLVEVEYAAEGTYCVRPLPEGRLALERAAEERREGRKARLFTALFSALGGAAGGFLGTALAVAVFLF